MIFGTDFEDVKRGKKPRGITSPSYLTVIPAILSPYLPVIPYRRRCERAKRLGIIYLAALPKTWQEETRQSQSAVSWHCGGLCFFQRVLFTR
jgi:hypothetical protein